MMRELNEYHFETSNKVEYNQEPPGKTRRLENTTGGNQSIRQPYGQFFCFQFYNQEPIV